MQHLLNKDHQLHKWRQHKSWTSYQGFQDVQDKQQMQYPFILRSEWKMHRRYLKFQNQNLQIFGYVSRTTNGQNHGPAWKNQSFVLSEICTVTFWQDLLCERQFEKALLEHGWEKVLNCECLFDDREKGLFLSVYVGDIKLAGKKQNIEPTWTMFMKDVDLGEPTSFLDHVHLGCTQRDCQLSKDIVDNYRSMFESRISAGAEEKLLTKASGKRDAETISSWSNDMEGHAKKCVER